jgi:hypothetical protein
MKRLDEIKANWPDPWGGLTVMILPDIAPCMLVDGKHVLSGRKILGIFLQVNGRSPWLMRSRNIAS